MAENTKIEWTDHTFNPWIGCTKVHTGCTHCYAEVDMDKRRGRAKWGPHGTRSVTSEAYWREPLKWNRLGAAAREQVAQYICRKCSTRYYTPHGSSGRCQWQCDVMPYRPRVFCASLADVFEDWKGPIHNHHGQRVSHVEGACEIVLTLDDIRRRLFALIDATPHLDWLLLTKRPENVRRMWPTLMNSPCRDGEGNVSHDFIGDRCIRCGGSYRSNVWIGTSVSDQATADAAIPELLKCCDLSPVLFLSAEPLLGPVDLSPWLDRLNWTIVGAESGPNSRRCDIAWIRSIVAQCKAANVPCFVKQLGARPEIHQVQSAAQWLYPNGVPAGVTLQGTMEIHQTLDLKDRKGGDWNEWPIDLRVREFPEVRRD